MSPSSLRSTSAPRGPRHRPSRPAGGPEPGPRCSGSLQLGRPQFSWTRIRGENPNVEGGRGHGSVEACEGSWVGATGVGADPAAVAAGALAPEQRWSASRKRDVVVRLLRGESLDTVSREVGVELYRLEARGRVCCSRRDGHDPGQSRSRRATRRQRAGAAGLITGSSVNPVPTGCYTVSMARQHRRQKQDVRLAVTESETRVRADIKAFSDKVDQLSRRSLLKRLAGPAGLGVTVLAWIFPRQRQVG